MTKFLIHRPIATIMVFVAFLMLGMVSLKYIPVSLMPDIAIPEITVQVSYPNKAARQLEDNIMRRLRWQLMQVPHLEDIETQTRNGIGVLHLKFKHGTNINYAFIETNEKVDAIMGQLPRGIERPKVIKASATDIPVFYLYITQKESLGDNAPDKEEFLQLSDFSEGLIKKRIEQIAEVAMVDISGLVAPELLIAPKKSVMQNLGITFKDVENILKWNNLNLGRLRVREGFYEYDVHFNTLLKNKEDVGNIVFNFSNRTFKLKDIAEIKLQAQKRKGFSTANGKPAISMAVIKQHDAQLHQMKAVLSKLVAQFEIEYPNIEFEIFQDQTAILSYTIKNLKQSLIFGSFLAFVIMFLFLRNWRAPILIGISIPSSLVITLLLFYFLNISINIISLSGLILGVGMMIDNAIIVMDNITRYKHSGFTTSEACVKGTSEVVRPMLSSVLTTCAVFIPLVFLSGISGALFYDQAMAVSIGLGVSFLVSITFLPVCYKLVYKKEQIQGAVNILKKPFYERWYEFGLKGVFKNKKTAILVFLAMIPVGAFLYINLDKKRLPPVQQNEIIALIEWNEHINIEENNKRVEKLFENNHEILQRNSWIGEQQFLLDNDHKLGFTEAKVYFKSPTQVSMEQTQNQILASVQENYPNAQIKWKAAASIFEKLFSKEEAPFEVRLKMDRKSSGADLELIDDLIKEVRLSFPKQNIENIHLQERLSLDIHWEQMLNLNIPTNNLVAALRTAFNENEIASLHFSRKIVPVILGQDEKTLSEVLKFNTVKNKDKVEVPISSLVTIKREFAMKSIVANKEGEFLPIRFNINEKEIPFYKEKIKEIISEHQDVKATFSGSLFSNQILIDELSMVLLVSILLLYFILSAQFESFVLPIIVLIEIPINLSGAFLALWLFGSSINIMSLIGIVVMSGVIINDSILKIDTINNLRKNGMPILEAIQTGGHYRLKPILMTSLTTILALVPFLFGNDLGSALQKPLAYAIIGGMILGTVISLYLIPLVYWIVFSKSKTKKVQNAI